MKINDYQVSASITELVMVSITVIISRLNHAYLLYSTKKLAFLQCKCKRQLLHVYSKLEAYIMFNYYRTHIYPCEFMLLVIHALHSLVFAHQVPSSSGILL